jgi:hypothetical protein
MQIGTGALRLVRAEVVVLQGDGSERGRATVDEVTGETVRLADVTVAPAGDGDVMVVWAQEDADEMGRIVAARVRHAGVAAGDGSVARAAATYREMSTSPFLAVEGEAQPWLLRTDIVLVGGVTGVIPKIVQLDPGGMAIGMERDLMAYLRPEALDVILETGPSGPFVAYRAGASTAVVLPLDEGGSPRSTERRHDGLPRLDGAAGADDAIALVGGDVIAGMGRIEALILDDLGNLRARHTIATDVPGGADVRAAVVAAYPGFVVIHRSGTGPTAQLRAAGLTTDGTLLLPPRDIVTVPGSIGALTAHAIGPTISVGSRARNAAGDHLQLAIFCTVR